MTITPAIKGQLTKAVKSSSDFPGATFRNVFAVFARHMPREQAKHATRKYLDDRSGVEARATVRQYAAAALEESYTVAKQSAAAAVEESYAAARYSAANAR